MFALPEESVVTVPRSSLKSHLAIKPLLKLLAALTLREAVVDAAIPEPTPLMTTGKTPVGVYDDVARVKVVLHVATQVAAENPTVTPAGSDDTEKATEAGRPDRRRAVTAFVVDCPCIKETA